MLRKPKTERRHPPRDRTPAQEAAWRVFRLRALWHQAGLLTGVRARAAQRLIDAEITERGFESEGDRQAARRAEWQRLAEIEDQEIPW